MSRPGYQCRAHSNQYWAQGEACVATLLGCTSPQAADILSLLRRELYVAVVKFGYDMEQVLGCFLVVGEQIPKLQLFMYYTTPSKFHPIFIRPVLLFF